LVENLAVGLGLLKLERLSPKSSSQKTAVFEECWRLRALGYLSQGLGRSQKGTKFEEKSQKEKKFKEKSQKEKKFEEMSQKERRFEEKTLKKKRLDLVGSPRMSLEKKFAVFPRKDQDQDAESAPTVDKDPNLATVLAAAAPDAGAPEDPKEI
jgi:hypothetical protein